MSEKRKLIAISGGFDPVHIGHVQMIEAAAELGDVMVIVNSDDWLLRKKGYVFMPWDEKAYIMSQFKGVTKVVSVDDTDGTVCEALEPTALMPLQTAEIERPTILRKWMSAKNLELRCFGISEAIKFNLHQIL